MCNAETYKKKNIECNDANLEIWHSGASKNCRLHRGGSDLEKLVFFRSKKLNA